ncbi:hypothetical protein IEQ34_005721 [Dendrobium chrysotoxum]|uniref:Uncharacterized protein n=1 Tax=Dendrobium chrysotoxum TaxID=161865 RepID=A0AAV7HDV2_DENCH|nr:hypothetical protein IEQ34_005721 [Dendrobium chrysotoxum]
MLEKGFNPTILTYNALIHGLCKNGEGDQAEDLIRVLDVFGNLLQFVWLHEIENLQNLRSKRVTYVFYTSLPPNDVLQLSRTLLTQEEYDVEHIS